MERGPHPSRWARLGRETRGATTVEYLTLIATALVAVAAIAALGASIEGGPFTPGADGAGEAVVVATSDRSVFGGGAGGGSFALTAGAGSPEGARAASAAGTPAFPEGGYAAVALLDAFEAASGGDDHITTADLERVAADGDADLGTRAAAAFLLDNEVVRHAIDVGAGRGRVDDRISRDDLEGALAWDWDASSPAALEDLDTLEEADAVVDRWRFLADAAAGRGDRDGDVSHDDLRALVEAGGVPPELRRAAELILRERPEEEDCGFFSLCTLGKIGGGIADFGTGVVRGAWGSVVGTWDVGVALVGFGGRLLSGDPEAWGTVWNGAVAIVTDPVGSAQTAWNIGGAIVEHYVGMVASCTTSFSAGACGEAVGEIGLDVVVGIATGGSSVAASAGRSAVVTGARATALTAARHVDEVAGAARGVRVATAAARHADDLPIGLCFVGGTLVLTPEGAVAIETLRVGDRVATPGAPEEGATEVDPATWAHLQIEMPDPRGAGDVLELELLRPRAWIEAAGAAPGASIHLVSKEMGLDGIAFVSSIAAAPSPADGAGRVVLATVKSRSATVMRLRVEGASGAGATLEPTAAHPLFSIDRGAWVPAGELRAGERLRTRDGDVLVASIEQVRGVHTVFNLEVETEHGYFVSDAAVWSHNQNPCMQPVGALVRTRHLDEISGLPDDLARFAHSTDEWRAFEDAAGSVDEARTALTRIEADVATALERTGTPASSMPAYYRSLIDERRAALRQAERGLADASARLPDAARALRARHRYLDDLASGGRLDELATPADAARWSNPSAVNMTKVGRNYPTTHYIDPHGNYSAPSRFLSLREGTIRETRHGLHWDVAGGTARSAPRTRLEQNIARLADADDVRMGRPAGAIGDNHNFLDEMQARGTRIHVEDPIADAPAHMGMRSDRGYDAWVAANGDIYIRNRALSAVPESGISSAAGATPAGAVHMPDLLDTRASMETFTGLVEESLRLSDPRSAADALVTP